MIRHEQRKQNSRKGDKVCTLITEDENKVADWRIIQLMCSSLELNIQNVQFTIVTHVSMTQMSVVHVPCFYRK